MRRIGTFLAIVSLLLLALPLATQEQPGTVARVFFVKPKAGMVQQFEEALKRHQNWHRQQNDTWDWDTWQIESGERFGQYVIGTFGHSWEDFDAKAEFAVADRADALANHGQFAESVNSGFYLFRADVSRPPEGEWPDALAWVVYVHLNIGREAEFNYQMKRVTEAINKTSWPRRYLWFELISGGEHPTLVRVHLYSNWAGFKPPEKSFPAMLEEAYGRQGAEAHLDLDRKAVHCVRTEIMRYRPDLSYFPPAPAPPPKK